MLIVDDDPAIVRFLTDRCAIAGFKIETGSNGMQAILMARRCQPDVLLIDVNMPEIDGLSVCARLLDSGKNRMDVVAITGSDDPEVFKRCESLGAFYGRKGPEFWRTISFALTTLFPDMADQIKEIDMIPTRGKVPTRPRVLLVDDDLDVAMFLSSRLGKYGVHTLYAPDGLHGFRIACKEQPTVIICDYFMPNGDARYLLWRLRSTPSTQNIPFIVLTGRQLDESTQHTLTGDFCGRPGATRILSKSLDPWELFKELQNFCGFEEREVVNNGPRPK